MGSWTSPGPVPGPVPPPETETDTMSNAQRSTLKWEKEETLGEMATVAPVLYTNMNFPNLQDEFPGEWMVLKCLKQNINGKQRETKHLLFHRLGN